MIWFAACCIDLLLLYWFAACCVGLRGVRAPGDRFEIGMVRQRSTRPHRQTSTFYSTYIQHHNLISCFVYSSTHRRVTLLFESQRFLYTIMHDKSMRERATFFLKQKRHRYFYAFSVPNTISASHKENCHCPVPDREKTTGT